MDVNKAIDYWNEKALDSGVELNEYGKGIINRNVEKYGLENVLKAIDITVEKYGINDKDEFEIAINKLGLILFLNFQPEYIKQIAYIKGMCRNKYTDFREAIASKILKMFYEKNGDLDFLQDKIRYNEFYKWGHIEKFIYDYLEL